MRVLITVLALFALFTVNFVNGQAPASTANPNASAAARAVLAYLYELPNRADNRVIAGQFGGFGDGQTVNLSTEHFEEATRAMGDAPALTGWDFWNTDQTIAQSIDEAWAFGQQYPRQLFTASIHFRNPWTNQGSAHDEGWMQKAPAWKRFPVTELTTRNTAAGQRYHGWLDEVAAGMQRFEDANRVILWRPFHEANGCWFWWCPATPAEFHALWRHMFNYFTVDKGLNNLLWVYAPNIGFENFDTFYPGSEYVDIIGFDYYKPLNANALRLNDRGEYTWAVSTGKPVYLSEFGARPSSGAGWDNYNYNYANLLRDIKADYPRIVGVLNWEYVWRLAYPRDTNQAAYGNDPWTITVRDLPDFNSGGVIVPTQVFTSIPTASPTPTVTPALSTNTPRATSTPQPTSTPPPLACVERVERYVNGVLVSTFLRSCQ
jgi:mannan endo-1,4-beta-mannosidase